uniref:Uncharacterized protein n=1 Tax=viral metagenome TaxID=1070528 RepID=A0A6M3LY08_9ZZZZ
MVNSIKLTNLEGRVLEALSKQRPRESYEYYPKEGNDTCGLAAMVYGQGALNCERVGGNICSGVSVAYSAKSSLSRALKSLWMKGMVKKCHPRYRRYWHKPNEWDRERGDVGFYGADLTGLNASWVNEEGVHCTDYVRASGFSQLPHRTRVWWILTDREKDIVEDITGIKRLRERCRNCECWDEDGDRCKIERIGKRALTLEECREEGYWHWVEYEGWVPGNIGTISSGESD